MTTEHKDISKAFGFAEGFNDRNSARIGFRWEPENGLMLFPYVHCNGDNLGAKDPKPICRVNLDTDIYCCIEAKPTYYLFTVSELSPFNGDTLKTGNYQATAKRGKGSRIKWKMFPYFGGNQPCPHNMTIKLDIL